MEIMRIFYGLILVFSGIVSPFAILSQSAKGWDLSVKLGELPSSIQINDNLDSVSLGPNLKILEVVSKEELPETFLKENRYTIRTFDPNKSPNFGYSNSSFWAYFSFQDKRSKLDDLYLVLDYAATDLIDLYCYDQSNSLSIHQKAGDHVPSHNHAVYFRKHTFLLDKKINHCWMNIKGGSSIQFPLILYSKISFIEMRLNDSVVQAVYFGALIAILFYNLILAISTKSLAYTIYSIFLTSYGLFQAGFSGYSHTYLWPNASPDWIDKSVSFFISCVGIFSYLFAFIILDLKKYHPKIYDFGKKIVYFHTPHIFLIWILPYKVGILWVFGLAFVWSSFLIFIAARLSLQKNPIAKIYLGAWMIFILGTMLNLMMILGILNRNFLTLFGQQIGSVVEFTMLSIALAYRLNLMQKSISMNLEKEVDAKTVALRSEKEKAVKALADLQDSREALSRMEREASLNQLSSHLAHEVNNPLNYISTGEYIAREGYHDARDFILNAIPDRDDTIDFKITVQSKLDKIIDGLNQTKLGTKKIESTITEIRAITGVDGKGISHLNLLNILEENIAVALEKNQHESNSINLYLNGKPWGSHDKFEVSLISQKFILGRAFRTVLSHCIYFYKKSKDIPCIQIHVSSIRDAKIPSCLVYIRNNGPPIPKGEESFVLDLKNHKSYGVEMIGMSMVNELLKSIQSSLTLTDHGRETGWVEFQIFIKEFV